MTAPGNSTLLLTILAAFLACTGYAAGRLHQWYRMGLDRDEAYRDGYDTATRSVFSLAARIITPRRERTAIRASVSVIATEARITPSAAPCTPTRSTHCADGPAPPMLPAPGVPLEMSADSSLSVWTLRSADPASPSLSGPPAGGSAAGSAGSGAGSAGSGGSLRAITEVAAGETPAGPAARPPAPGRHLVPDELVRADTYRLPPDRVARAKVRNAAQDDDIDGESTFRLPSVPKPRSS